MIYDQFNILPDIQPDQLMLANSAWPAFRNQHPNAVNTTIGVLLDPNTGAPLRFDSVVQAKKQVSDNIDIEHKYSYQTSLGNAKFLQAAKDLMFDDDEAVDITGFQSIGGTGALRLTNDALVYLMSRGVKTPTLVLDSGWPNHQVIFGRDFDIATYQHADYETGTYNHIGAVEALRNAPTGSIALFQVSGYNGDGLGRTQQQWDELLDIAADKGHVVVLDAAYMGLTGTIAEDAYVINQAAHRGLLTFANVSFSKNMGLYNERLGALYIVNARRTIGAEQAHRLNEATAHKVIRGNYSSPPLEAAETAAIVLTEGKEAFFKELGIARERLSNNRRVLAEIIGSQAPIVANGEGLFTILRPEGFTEAQHKLLLDRGIFAIKSSRINLGGIHPDHIARVGEALQEALKLTA